MESLHTQKYTLANRSLPAHKPKFAREYFFFNSTVIKNKKSSFPQKNKTYSTDKQRYMDKEKQALGGNIQWSRRNAP